MQEKIGKSKIFFGERLRWLRDQAGYATADDFAEACGVSRATVYNWERRERPPNAKYFQALSRALQMPIKDILRPRFQPANEPPAGYGSEPGAGKSPTRGQIEREVAHYLDRAEAAGALPVAALQVRKHLDPADFDYF